LLIKKIPERIVDHHLKKAIQRSLTKMTNSSRDSNLHAKRQIELNLPNLTSKLRQVDKSEKLVDIYEKHNERYRVQRKR